MSTSYLKGRNFLIYVDNIPVGCSKTCTVEVTTALSNSTTKCDVDASNALWTNQSPEENSWKITDSGTVPLQQGSAAQNETTGLALLKLQAAQTKCYVQFEQLIPGTGSFEWCGGDGYITSCKISAETTSDTTYDITIDGTGALSFLAVS